MITVTKSTTVPRTLTGTGRRATILNQQAYETNPSAYKKGTTEFKIESSIYGYETVKRMLREAQYNKCCFCEKEQIDEYAAVEHYRPKGGYKSIKGDTLIKPGYYWLGYEWKNLYFVCSACNTYKANYFPLTNERKRAKSHLQSIDQETPLLLDPAGPLNPQDHLTFDFQFIRSTSKFGTATIQICGLDLSALDEKRKLLIDIIKLHIAIYQAPVNEIITEELKRDSAEFLQHCQEPAGEFSSAAIAYLRWRNFQVNSTLTVGH